MMTTHWFPCKWMSFSKRTSKPFFFGCHTLLCVMKKCTTGFNLFGIIICCSLSRLQYEIVVALQQKACIHANCEAKVL